MKTIDNAERNDAGPEHQAPLNPAFSSSFDEFAGATEGAEANFLGQRGSAYPGVKDAFDFGFRLANEDAFRGRTWSAAEEDVRAAWARRKESGTWNQFRTSIEQGWETARGTG